MTSGCRGFEFRLGVRVSDFFSAFVLFNIDRHITTIPRLVMHVFSL